MSGSTTVVANNACHLYQTSLYRRVVLQYTEDQQSDKDLLHMVQVSTNTSHHSLKPCSLSPISLELLDVRLHADDRLSLRWPPTRFVYWLTLDRVSAASGAPLQSIGVTCHAISGFIPCAGAALELDIE